MWAIGRGPVFEEAGGGTGGGGDAGGGDPGNAPGAGDTPAGGEAPKPGALSNAGGWDYAEGVAGEGERPGWLNTAKYKSVAAQAEAYPELEAQIGKFGSAFGAPEGDYALTLPEGVTGEFDKDAPLLKQFQADAKEMGLSQEAFTRLVHGYVKNDAGLVDNHDQMVAQTYSDLGENGENQVKDTWDRLAAVLPADQAAALDELITSAPAIKAIQTLLASEASLPSGGAAESIGVSREELRTMRSAVYPKDHAREGKQMYGHDKDYTAKIDGLYAKRFPGEDVQTV